MALSFKHHPLYLNFKIKYAPRTLIRGNTKYWRDVQQPVILVRYWYCISILVVPILFGPMTLCLAMCILVLSLVLLKLISLVWSYLAKTFQLTVLMLFVQQDEVPGASCNLFSTVVCGWTVLFSKLIFLMENLLWSLRTFFSKKRGIPDEQIINVKFKRFQEGVFRKVVSGKGSYRSS